MTRDDLPTVGYLDECFRAVLAQLPAAAGVAGMLGLAIGTNGKLLDAEGYPVASLVPENEYVIPAWRRADPQVMQLAQLREQKRQRGFRQGGPTSKASGMPAAVDALAGNGEVQQQMLPVLERLASRPQDVEPWAQNLKIIQHTGELADVKKIQDASMIS